MGPAADSSGLSFRCPRCKTETEITDRRQTLCACPNCGLTGMVQRKTAAPSRKASTPRQRSPLLDAASTKTILWIILGSVGAVALALIVVVLLVSGRASSRTVAQTPRETGSDTIAPAQATASQTIQPVTPAPQRQSTAIEPRSDRASASQAQSKSSQSPLPSQSQSQSQSKSQSNQPVVVVVTTTPPRTATETAPAIITIEPRTPARSPQPSGPARDITIPDPSFEAKKAGYFPTFPGWTDVYPPSISIMHEVVSSSLPNTDGRKLLRLYMDCGGSFLSAIWEFRSPRLGRYEASTRYHLAIAMARSGDDDRRKVTIALCTPDAILASRTIPFGGMNEESFSDFNVDLDVRGDSLHIGKDIHIVIRCEAENTRHGRNLNIDNIRLTAQRL